jgi:tRNA pseudouridine55 synthase
MISGILLVDKPAGMTSHDVSHAIARKLQSRAGHTGTLDKFATGLLVVCIGKATKASRALASLPKQYRALAFLGRTTDTCDPEGKETSTSTLVPSAEEVRSEAAKFIGAIEQVPPLFSAKKIRGRRASDYARKGVEVKVRPVQVAIDSLDILEYDYPRLRIRLSCSSGTYVRSLVKDLGEALGCGAYTLELRRTKIGDFSVESALPFEKIMPMGAAGLEEHIHPIPPGVTL